MLKKSVVTRWRLLERAPWLLLVMLALAGAALGLWPVGMQANQKGSTTTLMVGSEPVRIYRDEFGRPHIFAATNRGLFEAYGYVVAQDRLWQLELNRRAARGRLAEALGPGYLDTDRFVHTMGYTDAELDAQFAILDAEQQAIFFAYRDGINRYVREVIAPDPTNKLPIEFQILGLGVPAPWEARDSIAFGAFMIRRFGEIGGRHLTNQALLNSLIAQHGEKDGYAIFNDVRWINDPDAPVTVPVDEAGGRPQSSPSSKNPTLNPAQLLGASEPWADLRSEAMRIWESLGVPTKLGSYAWVISPKQSKEGAAMLYGGPQMGFSTPEVVHEVQLTGGSGFNVTGMAFAGIPLVLIGRNERVAWTSTTATGGNVDTYIETLCDERNGYMFNGNCRPFERRVDTIRVRGADPVLHTVLRSVHGPVINLSGDFAASQRLAHWMREMETAGPFLAFDRAHNLKDFDAVVRKIVTSHNFLYIDVEGNIAYWQAGQVPLRPKGFDARLPLPGDGRAEWPGGVLPMPTSINPARGWLANWNNKPTVDYDNADEQIFGRQFRISDIDDRLAAGPISLEDMRDIPKDIARVDSLGREARFLKPYLLDALKAVPPSHPLAGQATSLLKAWDGSTIADAITSTQFQPAQVIFSNWLTRMRGNTFQPFLGDRVNEASTNMLIHVLDDALGGGSGVPPSRDYFNGADPYAAMSTAFDQTLTALGPDPAAWSAQARSVTRFIHPIPTIGEVGSIPRSNRATYGQIVLLGKGIDHSENIFTLGQSGFIRFAPPNRFVLDPHFRDQLDLFRNFQYKPMRLLAIPADPR